ncbi:MAG: RidA family protein [Desulfitobacterium sp.]|nr:RidA family protein [Desulfitobacterium sp.]
MSIQPIQTDQAPAAIGAYSQGVKVGGFIFTSGQLPLNPATGELETDIRKATKQALENVKGIIESAGSSMDKVIKVSVFLRDLEDFGPMNEVYSTYFSENPPARSAVQAARIPKDAIIEIDAIALVE